MRFKLLSVRTVIISVALVLGIIAGTFGSELAIAHINANSNPNQIHAPAPVFPKNENGQTYGSSAHATSPDTEPDLIRAYGVDGTLGYVLSVDLNERMPKTPQEALAEQKRRMESVRQIPLYDVNGVTIIGVFNVGGGYAIEHPVEDD